jgi:hypothetical protein
MKKNTKKDINFIIDNFGFNKVHDVMQYLDWR